jgi:hypothetical protein
MIFSAIVALAFAQLQPASANTGKSGQTVFVLPPKTLAHGAPIPPVVTQPTLAVDGQAVAMTPGPLSGGFYCWTLAAPVNAANTLALTAPAGWIAGYGALNLAVRNSTGKCEFVIPRKSNLAVGVNMSGPMFQWSWTVPSCPAKNWAYRMARWTNAKGYDAQGNPNSIVSPASTAFTTGFTNGIDNRGTPGMPGVYTLVWDSTDPQTQLAVTVLGGGWTSTLVPALSSPGTNGVGITQAFQVSMPATATANAPTLGLQLTHPKGTPSYSNLWIIPPGNSHDRSDPAAMEASVYKQLSTAGRRGPAVLRWMDSTASWGGQTNIVEPKHMSRLAPSCWTVANSQVKNYNVVSIRPLDLSVSPAFQSPLGPNTPFPSPDPLKMFSNLSGGTIMEIVTDVPHGISSGQNGWITLPAAIEVSLNRVQTPIKAWFAHFFVTSPTTAVALSFIWNVPPGTKGQIMLGGTYQTPGAYVQIAANTNFVPFGFAAAQTSKFDGCIYWLNFPIMGSDALANAIATEVLQNLGPTNKVAIELSNEVWNYGFSQWSDNNVMGTVLSLQAGSTLPSQQAFYVRRLGEVSAIFKQVFGAAGRFQDVLTIISDQLGGAWNRTAYAAKVGLKCDIMATAHYWDTRSDWVDIIPNWTPAQINDLDRHFVMLDPEPKVYQTNDAKARDAYSAAIGLPVQLWAYEGAMDRPWVARATTNYQAKACDAVFHPDAYDTQRVVYWFAQQAGLTEFTEYTFQTVPGRNCWCLWNWGGQATGDGSTNQMIGSGTVFPVNNVSVRGQAYKDWMAGWWAGRSAPNTWIEPVGLRPQ